MGRVQCCNSMAKRTILRNCCDGLFVLVAEQQCQGREFETLPTLGCRRNIQLYDEHNINLSVLQTTLGSSMPACKQNIESLECACKKYFYCKYGPQSGNRRGGVPRGADSLSKLFTERLVTNL